MTFAISASFLILQKIVWTKSSSAMDYMLLIFKDLKSCLSFSVSVIARLDRAIQKKELDYPVKPDNDNHWNRVQYE
jgi:hypothetical protein